MFTLAISCLTTSNLPWFMDLSFQVLMQYCSLQHWTLLPSPVTSTTGHCFHFGSASSVFLERFIHSSSSILGTLSTWGVHFQSHIFLPFHNINTKVYLSILLLTDICVVSVLGYCEENSYEHSFITVSMHMCSHWSWVHTRQWNYIFM